MTEPKKKRGIQWRDLPLERLTPRGVELVEYYANSRGEPRHVRDKLREDAGRYLTEFEPLFADKIPTGKEVALKFTGSSPVQYGFKDGPEERERKARGHRQKNKNQTPDPLLQYQYKITVLNTDGTVQRIFR